VHFLKDFLGLYSFGTLKLTSELGKRPKKNKMLMQI